MVPLLRVNISLNQALCPVEHAPKSESETGTARNVYESYEAMQHSWGESTTELNAAILCAATAAGEGYRGLLLVGSDVIYDPAGYQPLVTSIAALLQHHQILFEESRREPGGDGATAPMMVLTHRQRNEENVKCVVFIARCA